MNPTEVASDFVLLLSSGAEASGAKLFSAYESNCISSTTASIPRAIVSVSTVKFDSFPIASPTFSGEVEIELIVPRATTDFNGVIGSFLEFIENTFRSSNARANFNAVSKKIYAGELRLSRIETPSVSSDEELSIVCFVSIVGETKQKQ